MKARSINKENIRKIVRKGYGKIADNQNSCCGASNSSKEISRGMGYSEGEIESVPEGANMGLGCGNPVALASLKEGQTVLDLGSGAGFDCFLAARKVGARGKVIGVDMTPEMLDKARKNARKGKYGNVELRLGEIENLPVADNSVDVIISNCVINLSPEKERVFREAFRVLKPNGRLMVSDIVLTEKLPQSIRRNVEAYVGCIAGAETKQKYVKIIEDAGFEHVRVLEESSFSIESLAENQVARAIAEESDMPAEEVRKLVAGIASLKVSAVKPGIKSLDRPARA